MLYGARFYIVPAGEVTGFRAVPTRCMAEERAALERIGHQWIHPGTGTAIHAPTVQLQAQYLEWQRYRGAHAEGICLGAFSPVINGASHASEDCRYTVGDIERGSASTGGTDSTRGQLFYGVVPDGVALVTMRFSPLKGKRFPPTTAIVVRNIWALVPPPRAYFPSAWIWRDAAGHVLKTIPGPG